MDSKFSQTPSRGEKFKELALSALRAFGYGCLAAAGMSALIFAFAYSPVEWTCLRASTGCAVLCTSFLLWELLLAALVCSLAEKSTRTSDGLYARY